MARDAIPWWVMAVSGLGALLLLAGAVIAAVRPVMLAGPNEPITNGLRVMAGYVVARNAALGISLLIALLMRRRAALQTLLFLFGLVQLLDAVMDGLEGRLMIAPGVLVLAVLFVATANGLRLRATPQGS
jgi:hypothetical protein